MMHEVHCRRNIILCDKCNEPIPRSETEEHFNEYHALVKCSLCSDSVEVSALDMHKVHTVFHFNVKSTVNQFIVRATAK